MPDWHAGVLDHQVHPAGLKPWHTIPDFNAGDVKTFWELSRFDWVVQWAFNALCGDDQAVAQLNNWLEDWSANNPANAGVNWKCGQETSIRVIHLSVAASLLGQLQSMTPALETLLRQHLTRISPTISYAVAQDNNHGTSEAVALFIGGAWLNAAGRGDEQKHDLDEQRSALVGKPG